MAITGPYADFSELVTNKYGSVNNYVNDLLKPYGVNRDEFAAIDPGALQELEKRINSAVVIFDRKWATNNIANLNKQGKFQNIVSQDTLNSRDPDKVIQELSSTINQYNVNPALDPSKVENYLKTDLQRLGNLLPQAQQDKRGLLSQQGITTDSIIADARGKLARLQGLGYSQDDAQQLFSNAYDKQISKINSGAQGELGGVFGAITNPGLEAAKSVVPPLAAAYNLALPIATTIISGGIAGPAGLGLSGIPAGATAGAIAGGTTAAIKDQDVLEGALKGAVIGGTGAAIAPAAKTVSEAVGGGAAGSVAGSAAAGALKSGIGALVSGQDPLQAALTGGLAGGVSSGVGAATNEYLGDLPDPLQKAAGAAVASELLGGDTERSAINALVGALPGYAAGKVSAPETGEEGFFDIGGEGYSPYEEQYGFIADPMPGEAYFDQVIRDIEPGIEYTEAPYDDILAEIGQLPTGGFIGENVQSGIPEWDEAAQRAGLELEAPPPYNPYEEAFQKIGSSPDGNLEQDFVVDQNGNIIDTAGNRGEFIDGDWVVRTDPRDFSGYVAAPGVAAPAPAAPAPAPAVAPKTAAGPGLNLNALIAALAAAGYKEEEPDPYQVAQINVQSPFGTGPYASTGQYT
jgi:hypothetical protein